MSLNNIKPDNITPQGLLILIVPPSLEEMLVDVLLQESTVSGFTSSKVSGHGSTRENSTLSIVEQVTGRQQRVQFMMHASIDDLKNLVIHLKSKFRSTDIHYILIPVLAC